MSFLQPLMLIALPLIALPILIHLINQWRYQTKQWGAMMFLLSANRMNRGFAKLRQWLILAMRTLAIAGLILAVARPLASGMLGWTGGGKTDTTLVLLDRSPSMQQQGIGGDTKLATARRQLTDALQTLGSQHWVTIDSTTGRPQAFESLAALMDSPALAASSATADLPSMMQSALDYLQENRPGPTEVWIASDLRAKDWNADSGSWSLIREGFEQLPQSVRFNLLAYPSPAKDNLAIRVSEVRRAKVLIQGVDSSELLLSMTITKSNASSSTTASESSASAQANSVESVPVEIEIDGARSTLTVELSGNQAELRNQRVPLASQQQRGWGRVSLPADSNNADNDFYFVFDDPPVRRVVIEDYVDKGGQVLFFPPTSLTSGGLGMSSGQFLGIAWDAWLDNQKEVFVENWRGDQDLLAATASGTGLPVGQLKLSGYARLKTEEDLTRLATLTGGDPLLARLPTERGGVYFCTASPSPAASSMAESGVVLFVTVQRAILRGQEALGNTTQRTATGGDMDSGGASQTVDWRQVAGPEEVLSTEFGSQAGVYRTEKRMFAVNRDASEDRPEQVGDERLESLFAGLPLARVDEQAGSLSGIVREVWRMFLICMIVALLLEAILCLPRYRPSNQLGPKATT